MGKGHGLAAAAVFTSRGASPALEDHAEVNPDKGIFVVSDGFGGPAAGLDAARTACESVRRFLEKEAGDEEATMPFVLRAYFSLAGNILFNSLIFANRTVNQLNKGRNVHEKGGASVLAGYLDGNLLALANAGACSAWLFRGGKMTRLVTPRNYGWMRDPFSEDSDEPFSAPLIALGMVEDLEPEIIECHVRPGDWVLLQTAGVRASHREELLAIHNSGLPPNEAAHAAEVLLQGAGFGSNASLSLAIF